MITTYLSEDSLARLTELIGTELLGYGTDIELDEGVGAFGAWLHTDQGYVGLEYLETVVEFGDEGERVESVLTVHPLSAADPGGEEHPLPGTITAIQRVQDVIRQITKPEQATEWEWWRDSGVRITLDSGRELLIHCASPVEIEVDMVTGPAGTAESPTPKDPGRVYQEGEKRRFEYERRETPVPKNG